MLGVTTRSPTFTSLVDSGSADGMPVDFLDHFFDDELLSDRERSEWVASRRVLTWSLECLQAELQAAATVYVRSGLCYAPSPRGQPYRSASTGKGWCGLILLAAFPNANTKDANVYVDPETGAYQSCYTWDELDAFTRAATWPDGQERFELRHVSLFVELLQAKACTKQPCGAKEFHIRSLLAKKRVQTLSDLIESNRAVLKQQLAVLKANGCTEARVLSIGEGKALHEMAAQELAEAGLPCRSAGVAMHFSNGWRGNGDLQKLGREADAALRDFTGATSCSYFEERGCKQSEFTTDEARFEHASKKAKKAARTRRANADAAGVTLASTIRGKFGDADGADPSASEKAGALLLLSAGDAERYTELMAKGAAATKEELEEAKGLLASARSERSSVGEQAGALVFLSDDDAERYTELMAKGAAATKEELEEAKGLLARGRSERGFRSGAASYAAAGSVNKAGKLIKEMGDRGQGRKAGEAGRAKTCYGCGQLGTWAKCPRNPEKQHSADLHEDGGGEPNTRNGNTNAGKRLYMPFFVSS